MARLQIYSNADLQRKAVYVKFVLDNDAAVKSMMQIDRKLKPFKDIDGKGVQIVVPLNSLNSFMNGNILPTLISKANELGYESPDMQMVKDDLAVASKTFATPKEKEAAVKKTNDLLERFFEKYNEPQVQELMHKLMSKIKVADEGDEIYKAALLSLNNRVMAYAQKPDATFIASARIWRQYYKRRVMSNATPIIISAGNNGNYYDSKFASDKLGVDRAEARQNSHTNLAFDRTAKYGTSDPTAFFGVVYYDVSDTQPYDVNEDRFNDDSGLKSNLTGELNAKALHKRGEVDTELDGKIESNSSNEEMIFNNIVEYASDKPSFKSVMIAAANKNGKDPSAAADVVEALFRVLFEREHDTKALEEKVKKCTVVILALYNASTARMLNYMAQHNDKFNLQDLRKMYAQVSNVKYIIEKEINESVGSDLTFKEFLDMLHVDINSLKGNDNPSIDNNQSQNSDNTEMRENISESFRRFWNRMI